MNEALTVSQLNNYVKMLLDGDPLLSNLVVRGEISNFTNHVRSGHFYFSLKDENARVQAVMFRSDAQRMKFMPENGMKVILWGRISLFPRDGQYQIYASAMEPDGLGALYAALEQLKKKLADEGLFDEARKRPLPPYPEKIGIITSPEGAAVQDMIHILGRRFPVAKLYLYPALVQGSNAPESLRNGLAFFNDCHPVDLILIGRGGGAPEDLWAFNDEQLVRAVVASRIPVISAVGHESDYTLCDFAADLRASTPSAAAERAVPEKAELLSLLSSRERLLSSLITNRIERERARLSVLASSRSLRSPVNYLEDRRMELLHFGNRMNACASARVDRSRRELAVLCARMDALHPLRVLARGYAAVYSETGKPVESAMALRPGERVKLLFADSSAQAEIKDIRKGQKYGGAETEI